MPSQHPEQQLFRRGAITAPRYKGYWGRYSAWGKSSRSFFELSFSVSAATAPPAINKKQQHQVWWFYACWPGSQPFELRGLPVRACPQHALKTKNNTKFGDSMRAGLEVSLLICEGCLSGHAPNMPGKRWMLYTCMYIIHVELSPGPGVFLAASVISCQMMVSKRSCHQPHSSQSLLHDSVVDHWFGTESC